MTSADDPRPDPGTARPQVPYAHPAGGAGSIMDPLDPTKTGPHVPGTPVAAEPPGGERGARGTGADDPGLAAEAFSGLSFLAGLWLVIAPFALDHADAAAVGNDVAVGVAVAVVALVRMLAPVRTAAVGIVTIALGVWLVAAPFVLDLPPTPTANDIVVGILLVVFATASTLLGRRARQQRGR